MIFETHKLAVNVGAPDILAKAAGIDPDQPFDAMPITAWSPVPAGKVESMFLTGQVFPSVAGRRA